MFAHVALSYLVFFALISSAQAYVTELSGDGLGLETLMSGVGQARIGSLGSVNSNPSLLAFLPEKDQFITTNVLNIRRAKDLGNGSPKYEPQVVPVYAASTGGKKDWGYSYGINFDTRKSRFTGNSESLQTTGSDNFQNIKGLFGYGKKLTPRDAIGVSLSLGRLNRESTRNFNGQNILGNNRRTESLWTSAAVLGGSHNREDWAIGYSLRFNLFKFAHEASTSEQSLTAGQASSLSNTNRERARIIPSFSAGSMRKFSNSKVYFDLHYVPAYTDTDAETNKVKAQKFFFRSGLEQDLNWKDFIAYGGVQYYPTPDEPYVSSSMGQLMGTVGLSKVAKNSHNFGGISWRRPIKFAAYEDVGFIFGTRFNY